MAYPTICQPCLEGRHDECEQGSKLAEKLPEDHELVGGWLCVCAHGGKETLFQREVRERAEKGWA